MRNEQLIPYETLTEWNAGTLPEFLRNKHNNQEGTWAKLQIKQGSLDFELMDEDGHITSNHHFSVEKQPTLIVPQQWYRITKVSEDLVCQLSFYCQAEDFVKKKYHFSRTHSEVINAFEQVFNSIAPKQRGHYQILDLGCGQGRNSIYLALKGFKVTACDIAESKINNLNQIANENQLEYLSAEVYDINQADIKGQYHAMISTVVLMMLDTDKIPAIIQNMQAHTVASGYHLIVSVMDTEDYPCARFSHKFKTDELKNYYQDWEIIKYNENVGRLYQVDANGNPYQFRFATLLAKKLNPS